MNPNDEYKELVSKLVSCRNIFELKNTIKEVNTFIVRYQIPDRSETFLKLKNLIDLTKIKLKNKKGIDEAVEFIGSLINKEKLVD